jgi:Flp pilus assembly protein CpaB
MLGVIAATSAALLIATLRSGPDDPKAQEIEILVATKTLGPSERIKAEYVEKKPVQRSEAPAGYFTNPVQIVGKTLIVAREAGQPFTAICFGAKDTGADLAADLVDGMRATCIPLDVSSSLETLLYPGCRVDVMLTTTAQNGREPDIRTILRYVRVLGIDGWTVKSSDEEASRYRAQKPTGSRTVTVELSHRDASALQLWMTQGKVSLVMCNPGETAAQIAPRVTLSELLGAPPPTGRPVASQPGAPPTWEMTIIEGENVEKKAFPAP